MKEEQGIRSQETGDAWRKSPLRLWQAGCIASFLSLTALSQAFGQSFDEAYDGVEYYEPPVVRDAAHDVLDSPEFRTLPRLNLGPGGELADPLKKKEEKKPEAPRLSTPSSGPSFFSSLFGSAVSFGVVIVLLIVLGGIIALIVLGMRRWERSEKEQTKTQDDAASDDEPEPLVTPGAQSADAWLNAARKAAAAGRFNEAVALLLLGAMGHAEHAGFVRPRRGLTYRDYLRAVPKSSVWHATLDRLIRAYAPIGFGRRDATASTFDELVEPYQASLAAEPTPGGEAAVSETPLSVLATS